MIYHHRCRVCATTIEYQASIAGGYVTEVSGPEYCPECRDYIDHAHIHMDSQIQLNDITKTTYD